jgi:hypothetical protein
MTIVLDSTFATPEAVGKELGVPKARVRWLKRLVTFSGRTVGKKLGDKNGTGISASPKKTKHTRGKVKKVSR